MRFLFIVIFTLSALPIHANRIGGLLGYRLNTNTTDASTYSYNSTTAGHQMGGLAWLTFTDMLAIRTGIIYANKDAKGSVDLSLLGATRGDFTLRATYFDVPINLEISPPGLNLYVFGGFKYGIRSTSNCEIDFAGATCLIRVKESNFMANGGVGYYFELAVLRLGLELEYEHGLVDITESSDDTRTRGYSIGAIASVGF